MPEYFDFAKITPKIKGAEGCWSVQVSATDDMPQQYTDSLASLSKCLGIFTHLSGRSTTNQDLHRNRLNFFIPKLNSAACDAILSGNIEELLNSAADDNTEIVIADHSWVVLDEYHYSSVFDHSYSGFGSEEQIREVQLYCDYGYTSPKTSLIGSTLEPLKSQPDMSLNVLLLSVFCNRVDLALQLIARDENLKFINLTWQNYNFFEILWLIDSKLINQLIHKYPKEFTEAFFTAKQKGFDSASFAVFSAPCQLTTLQVVEMFTVPSIVKGFTTRSDYSVQCFIKWIFNNNINYQQVINDESETILFIFFKIKAVAICSLILMRNPKIDLTIENSDGKKCFELLPQDELFKQLDLLALIINNDTALKACKFLADDSDSLHQVLNYKTEDDFKLAKMLYLRNPKLLSVSELSACAPKEIDRFLPLIKDKQPLIWLEYVVTHFDKKSIIQKFRNQEEFCDFVNLHSGNYLIKEHQPDLYKQSFAKKYSCILSF